MAKWFGTHYNEEVRFSSVNTTLVSLPPVPQLTYMFKSHHPTDMVVPNLIGKYNPFYCAGPQYSEFYILKFSLNFLKYN